MSTEQTTIPPRTHSVEQTGLATRDEFSTELAPTAAAAEKQYEIQSSIIIAKRFPRDEDAAFQKLMKACGRSTFAEDAEYSFPRGGQPVTGPSVALAREAARVWTNIRHGLTIIRDDAQSRQIQGWAWDVETNTKVTAEDDFQKLIYRKNKGWIPPDERDLRELTNRRGAILIRNCILQLLPKDLIEDAVAACRGTLQSSAAQDPGAARKKILLAFSELNITAEMLTAYLGHPVGQCSPAEIADLRAIYKSISDGNSRWSEYVAVDKTGEQPDIEQERIVMPQRTSATVEQNPSSAPVQGEVVAESDQLPLAESANDAALVIDGITFPIQIKATDESEKASLALLTVLQDEATRAGVNLYQYAWGVLSAKPDELSVASVKALTEVLKQKPDAKKKK